MALPAYADCVAVQLAMLAVGIAIDMVGIECRPLAADVAVAGHALLHGSAAICSAVGLCVQQRHVSQYNFLTP